MTDLRVPIGSSESETVLAGGGVPLVLLVEDKTEIHILIKSYLRNQFELMITRTGEEAMELLHTHRFAAVIMDIGLEGKLTGIDVTRFIRSTPALKNTPVIVLTAYSMKEMEEKCFDAGCNEFLKKPASRQHLVGLLEKYASMKQG